jgi:hypothetical protein
MVIMSSAALCRAYGVIQSGKNAVADTYRHRANSVDPTLLQFPSFRRGETNRSAFLCLLCPGYSSVQEFRDVVCVP